MYKKNDNKQANLHFPVYIDIPKDHIVVTINQFVDSIPKDLLYSEVNAEGRPSYDPAMLLKVILFAYTRKIFSGRQIENLVRENIPAKWLVGDPELIPSYRTIDRFRAQRQTKRLIEAIYLAFRSVLENQGFVTAQELFPKSDLNSFKSDEGSFIWLKALEKYRANYNSGAKELYQKLVQDKVNQFINKNGLF